MLAGPSSSTLKEDTKPAPGAGWTGLPTPSTTPESEDLDIICVGFEHGDLDIDNGIQLIGVDWGDDIGVVSDGGDDDIQITRVDWGNDIQIIDANSDDDDSDDSIEIVRFDRGLGDSQNISAGSASSPTRGQGVKREPSPSPVPLSLPPQPSPPPVNVTTSPRLCELHYFGPGTGFGLVATTNIQRGQLIVREKPFMTVTHPFTSADVQRAFEQLSDKTRLLFLSFPDTIDGEGEDVWTRVATTNIIPCARHDAKDDDAGYPPWHPGVENDGPSASGLFEHISRLNHSCAPNATWGWDDDLGEETLHALVDIPVGQEITASYIADDQTLLPRAERQEICKEDHNFTCLCAACDVSTEKAMASDNALATIRTRLEEWESMDPGVVADRARNPTTLDDIQGVLRLIRAERRLMFLDHAYGELFIVHAARSQKKEALAAGRQQLDCLAVKFGAEVAKMFPVWSWCNAPEKSEWWALLSECGDTDDEDEDESEDGEDESQDGEDDSDEDYDDAESDASRPRKRLRRSTRTRRARQKA